ncbi:MAG: hypothetical protein ACOCQD_04610 [archaeon]
MLKDLNNLVEELNQTNSNNDKKEVLEKYPQCQDLLYYIYSPFTQFNVTSKNLKKRMDLAEDTNLDIISLLKQLNNLEITGHKALAVTNGFIVRNSEYKELIYKIIDKNLKTRTDIRTINKVFPGLIPEFHVALANKYEDQAHKIDFENDDWYASRKLDGVRVLARVENGKITLFSRAGKEFWTLSVIQDEISRNLFILDNFVLDGELCIVDENGNEDFSSIIKEIRRKDHIIENPKYKVFDILTLKEFDNQKGDTPLNERINRVSFQGFDFIESIEHIKIESTAHLQQMTDNAVDSGWEGLIIRKDVGYEGKRSNDLLKVKKMHDAEYTIKDVVMGPLRYIKNGKDVEEEMLSAVLIEHKGNIVRVGSGFSIPDRQYYYQHPEEIIGKEATIKFFEESTDQNGNKSLRFPIVKHIYKQGRDV